MSENEVRWKRHSSGYKNMKKDCPRDGGRSPVSEGQSFLLTEDRFTAVQEAY